MIESLMHCDEGVIRWTWRVAVARDYWRRTVGVPDHTMVHMRAAEGVSYRMQKVHESCLSRVRMFTPVPGSGRSCLRRVAKLCGGAFLAKILFYILGCLDRLRR